MALDDARKTIDSIDDRILALLEERANAVEAVRRAKEQASAPLYDPERERQILDRLSARAGRFPRDAIRNVYREVMSACLALQEPIRVAFLGPEGTFTHAAAREMFGLAAAYQEAVTIDGVFAAVRAREVGFGVVPIENSTEGAVTHAVDALVDLAGDEPSESGAAEVLIRREYVMQVAQSLLSRARGLTEVERVYSHPQALAQCRHWLLKNLPSAQLIQTPSTGAAVRELLVDPHAAAVGSRLSGELLSIPVLADRIQDRASNATRFVVLATEEAPPTGRDKTTLAFTVKDGRGALRRVLEVFDDNGVNLSRIESRPSRRKAWDYVFVVDVEGHRTDPELALSYELLRDRCPFVKHLGSYPVYGEG